MNLGLRLIVITPQTYLGGMMELVNEKEEYI